MRATFSVRRAVLFVTRMIEVSVMVLGKETCYLEGREKKKKKWKDKLQ
jgi:hypothetical protein